MFLRQFLWLVTCMLSSDKNDIAKFDKAKLKAYFFIKEAIMSKRMHHWDNQWSAIKIYFQQQF